MTPVEIMALIIAVIGILKLIVLAIKPEALKGSTKIIKAQPCVAIIVCLVLAGLCLKYLLVELTIVQIMAVTLFYSLLVGSMFASFSKEWAGMATKVLNKNILKRAWLPIIVWLVLMIWVLKELFA